MNKSFKVLVAVLAIVMIAMIPAMAELADGSETVTFSNGISMTYNKYEFKVDQDEDGIIYGEYLGEVPEPVGFNIVDAVDTDAKAYISEAAENYNTIMITAECFPDGKEWYIFADIMEDGDYTTVRNVYARNNSTGCWIVTIYGYSENYTAEDGLESELTQKIDDELSAIVDSLKFPE